MCRQSDIIIYFVDTSLEIVRLENVVLLYLFINLLATGKGNARNNNNNINDGCSMKCQNRKSKFFMHSIWIVHDAEL